MTTEEDFEVIEGDDIGMFSEEGQAAIRAAEADLAAGKLETVPHGAVDAILERKRLQALKAG
jgi:hypothetical protein